MKRILSLFVFLGLICTTSSSQVTDSLSADAWFNQGNGAFNNEQYGDAVFYYEKSLILKPGASDAMINLELSKERLDTDIVELDAFFLAEWWQGIYNLFNPGTWKIISIILLIGIVLILYLFMFKNERLSKKMAYGSLAVLTTLLLLTIFAGNSRSNSIFKNAFAVISGDAKSLYLAPDEVSEKIKSVTSGVKVKVLDSDSDWYKVATLDSEQGWIKKKNVRALCF